MLQIKEIFPSDRSTIRLFIDLPFMIYQDIPQWVPSFRFEEKGRFNTHNNPFYSHSEAGFFIVLDGLQVLGRIAVINNRLYNEKNKENTAFFFLFESINKLEIAELLFQSVTEWAKSRGLNKIVGPKGFTPLDGFGMLARGFEHRPAFGIPYNPPYYIDLLENLGFKAESESVSGYINTSTKFPERIHELADRIRKRRGLTTTSYRSRNDLKKLVPGIKDLYNGALAGMEGGTPITEAEANSLASQILWFANPRLIKIIKKIQKNNEPEELVGFLFAYPDVSKAVQKTKGRIFPFGWITLLNELNKTDWININGAGLIEEYRGLGGTAILFSEMEKSLRGSKQFKHADIVQIGVENDRMQREMENFGIDFYKLHRVYARSIE